MWSAPGNKKRRHQGRSKLRRSPGAGRVTKRRRPRKKLLVLGANPLQSSTFRSPSFGVSVGLELDSLSASVNSVYRQGKQRQLYSICTNGMKLVLSLDPCNMWLCFPSCSAGKRSLVQRHSDDRACNNTCYIRFNQFDRDFKTLRLPK